MLRPSKPSVGGSSQTGGATGPVKGQYLIGSDSGPRKSRSDTVPDIFQPCVSPSVIQFNHEEAVLSCRWSYECARIWGLKWFQYD